MLAAATLVVVFGGLAAGRDEKLDARLLVGKWEPKEGPEKGKFSIEFTKDGKILLAAGGSGKEVKAEGTYKLDGNKLSYKVKLGDAEKAEYRVVHSLTKTELTSSDEQGTKHTLVRVGGKK